MAERKLFNRRQKLQEDSREMGFGNIDARQKRLVNADGTYNYKRVGLPFYETFNFYHFLVTTPFWKFIVVVVLWYTTFNFVFTGIYYIIGADNLTGMIYKTPSEKFWEVYFFSAQTLTTVGYGRVNPMGFWESAAASFEALLGLLSFALFTGLLYARFAKAPSVLMFAKQAVVAPFTYKGQTMMGLMFRSANQYNTNLLNMKAEVSLSLLDFETLDAAGQAMRRFVLLPLERTTISFFPSSWTVVHPIDENSPIYGMTEAEFEKSQPVLMILVSGFDETFDQNVYVRHSYSLEEIEWGAKYTKIFGFDAEGNATVDLGNLSTFELTPVDHLLPSREVLEN